MKKIMILALTALAFASCAGPKEDKVMARAVPERADDFIWENDLVIYRAYGEALETSVDFLTSPGFDIWVKMPGALVADKLYRDELENGLSYHNFRGLGKDCYKVSKSLGGGASAPLIADTLRFPATNFRNPEVLEKNPEKVVFVLHYPEWEACGYKISLDKKITVTAGSRFCDAEDTYTFSGPSETLEIAAGIIRHDVEDEFFEQGRIGIWEHASDQSKEPENGMIGLGICMDSAVRDALVQDHSVLVGEVRSGEPLRYSFGCCWSKAGVPTAADWFSIVAAQ